MQYLAVRFELVPESFNVVMEMLAAEYIDTASVVRLNDDKEIVIDIPEYVDEDLHLRIGNYLVKDELGNFYVHTPEEFEELYEYEESDNE